MRNTIASQALWTDAIPVMSACTSSVQRTWSATMESVPRVRTGRTPGYSEGRDALAPPSVPFARSADQSSRVPDPSRPAMEDAC